MAIEELKSVLSEFGKGIGIPHLCFDDRGYCCISFDEVVVNMELDKASERLFFYSRVGALSGNALPELYEMLLEANCLYRGTFGGCLGIDRELKAVVLAYQIPVSQVDLPQFHRILENFVNAAELWVQKIDRLSVAQTDEPPAELSIPPEGIRV